MKNIKLIAGQFLKTTLRGRAFIPIYSLWLVLAGFAAYWGHRQYQHHNEITTSYQEKARQSWEANPDKHPHRMAHFGSFAFRVKHPLAKYDNGMENFTGNAVYLEAHKQNTVNFSDAGMSSGLLRFGELSISILLQLLLPLIIFFLGFDAVVRLRENGTLKILLTQGTNFKQIILGNITGLFITGLLLLVPVLFVTSLLLPGGASASSGMRFVVIMLTNLAVLFVISTIAIAVSALSATAREALLKLLGLWLLMAIIIPKSLQAAGNYLYPAPGKTTFEMAVEADILKQGDSHNPDDPHYKHLKDSVLRAHNVDSVQDLPFNYSGFQMREGERMSAEVYNQHLAKLHDVYDRQNSISYAAAFIDPLIGFRNLSMAFRGTDFAAYRDFQRQAEAYRYHLAQTMNQLQIELISNKKPAEGEKPHAIEQHHWTDFPDFHFEFQSFKTVFNQQLVGLLSMLSWLILAVLFINYSSRKAKSL